MTDPVLIVVEPTSAGKRGTRYRAWLSDGEVLLESARTPFFDGARELLRRGHDASTVLEMRHRGASIVAMRSTIGRAASLMVVENDKLGPVVKPWVAFSAGNIKPRNGNDDPEVA